MFLDSINKIKTLVLMQLKDKINLNFLSNRKTLISTIVYATIKFVISVFFVYVLLFAAQYLKIFNISNFIPSSVITVIFAFMLFLSIVFCTFSLMNKLYFSKDNFILLSLPVNTNKIFLSKIIVFFIYELKRNINFLIPLFFSYGILSGFPFFYYLWVLFAFVLISALTVAVSALLTIPAMFVNNFFKRKLYLQVIVSISAVTALFIGMLQLISLMPDNINLIGVWGSFFWKIQDLLSWSIAILSPIHRVTVMIVGQRVAGLFNIFFMKEDMITFLYLVLSIVFVMALAMVLVKPFFFKMATKPFEHKIRRHRRSKKNIKSPALIANLKKEIILMVRSPKNIVRAALVFSALPIAIFLSNNIYAAMNTRLLGQYMVFSFNLLMILLIVMSFNIKMASVYSREGASSYLMKTSPGNQFVFFFSKIIIEGVLVLLSVIATLIILQYVNPMPIENVILFFITVIFVYLAHLVMSAGLDIVNPQIEHYIKSEENDSNPNENKSAISSLIIACLFFVISLFLFMEGVFIGWVKVAAIALAFFIFMLYLFINKVKIYYKER